MSGDPSDAARLRPSYEPRPGLTHRDADWSGLRVLVAGLGGQRVRGRRRARRARRRSSPSSTRRAPAESRGQRERANILDILGVDGPAGPGAHGRYAGRGRRPRRHLPGVAARPADAPRGGRRAASRSGARSSSPGGCARRTGPRRGSPSPAPTARRRRSACSRRSCGPPACGRAAPATSAPRSSRRCCTREPFDVIAVELSSFQLHWQRSVVAGRVGLPQRRARPPRLARLVRGVPARPRAGSTQHTAGRVRLQRRRPAHRAAGHGGRRRRGLPGRSASPSASRRSSMVGLVDDVLADRAFVETAAAPRPPSSATLRDLQGDAPSSRPHYVANALAAAALARAYGVRPAVGPGRAAGLPPRPAPDRRRRARSTASGSSTTPRPPTRTRPRRRWPPFEHVVWIAGGLLKGAPTSRRAGHRRVPTGCAASSSSAPTAMRIAEALARHAPDVPVVDVGRIGDCGCHGVDVVDDVVARAAELAHPGDVVLLAPAAASMDMFANYGARGDAFEAAVRRCGRGPRVDDQHGDPSAGALVRPRVGHGARPRPDSACCTGHCRSSRASSRRSPPTTCCSARR